MTDAALHRWTASDGVELAYYETGAGRPVILLHGLFSSAQMNWIKFGHADRIASEGFRVITPDLRAHGESGKPHDPAKYSADILVRDLKELIAHLKLERFDLSGLDKAALLRDLDQRANLLGFKKLVHGLLSSVRDS